MYTIRIIIYTRLLLLCNVINIDGYVKIKKPPMGWMSWEAFGCEKDCITFPDTCISEKLFKTMADELVKQGFAAKGYEYVNIDDCYLDSRGTPSKESPRGDLRANPTRFPSGLSALSKYIHDKNLKFGVYNDIGRTTCAGTPGLNVSAVPDKEADAQLRRDVFVMKNQWDIDSIKVDGCASNKNLMNITYPKLGRYLNNNPQSSAKPIVYSCSWPVYIQNLTATMTGVPGALDDRVIPWQSVTSSCSTWRIYKDIMDAYNLERHAGIKQIIGVFTTYNATLRSTQSVGAYHDPDMLLIGNHGLSKNQAQIQFGLWSMWSAPLLLSVDLRKISNDMRNILLNEEVIAINQDALGIMATPIILGYVMLDKAEVQLWYKPLMDGGIAVAIVNMGVFDAQKFNATFTSNDVGLRKGQSFNARDLYQRKDLGVFQGGFSTFVDPTSIIMLKITSVNN